MNDFTKEAMTRLAKAVENETRKLLEDAIAKRLALPVAKFEDYLERMHTVKIGGSTIVYLDLKELISISVEYFRKDFEIGYNIHHQLYEAPNVH